MSELMSKLFPKLEDEESLGLKPGKMKDFHLFVWRNRIVWLVGWVCLFAVADQWTKIWAQNNLAEERTITKYEEIDGTLQEVQKKKFFNIRANEVHVIPSALSFIYRENPAAAFSLSRSIPYYVRMPMLIAVSSLAMLMLLGWYFLSRRPDGLFMTAVALILSGAIGNLIDRVRLGYVIDFINAYAGFINPKWPAWPTFNIADSCIVIGAFVVLFRAIYPLYPEKVKEEPAGEVEQKGS